MPTQRADKAVVSRRIEDLYRILLEGAQWVDVRSWVREQEGVAESNWFVGDDATPLSNGHIRRYQRKAFELIEKSHERSRRKLFRRHLAQRRHLFAKAALAGDVRAALACLRDEAEMLGLYPDKLDELTKRLNAAVAKLDAHQRAKGVPCT